MTNYRSAVGANDDRNQINSLEWRQHFISKIANKKTALKTCMSTRWGQGQSIAAGAFQRCVRPEDFDTRDGAIGTESIQADGLEFAISCPTYITPTAEDPTPISFDGIAMSTPR